MDRSLNGEDLHEKRNQSYMIKRLLELHADKRIRRVSPESGTYPYDAQFLRFKTGSIDLRPVLAWRIKSNLTLLRGARGVRLAPCES